MSSFKTPLAYVDSRPAVGRFRDGEVVPVTRPGELAEELAHLGRPLCLLDCDGQPALGKGGQVELPDPGGKGLPVRAWLGAVRLADLGDTSFCRDLGLNLPYVAGAMANGISSPEMGGAMGRAGMLGFCGSGGLAPDRVEQAIDRMSARLGDLPWGCNLINTPDSPDLERKLVDLYLKREVRLISAAAYLDLTLPLVRYRVHGIHVDVSGQVVAPNRIMAKLSRIEVARRFFSPPPERLLAELIARNEITEAQARLATSIPMAQDVTVEADSGGHTDKRSGTVLLPTVAAERDRQQTRYGNRAPLRLGAAGGIATPLAAAGALAMGAGWLLTGSVNQACGESGTSDKVRELLAAAGQADVTMAPAADMFDLGIQLQVLKRGTLFAMRARKLYELYRSYPSLDQIPSATRASIEKSLFRTSLDRIWEQTRAFWSERDPAQVERAAHDPKHRMALVFRWYLGRSSRWANCGEPDRVLDYQIWCGPAMGAFNEWVGGSFLEGWENRRVVPVAMNILHGAAVVLRANALRNQGVALGPGCVDLSPREPDQLSKYLE